jgi:hypothetical protein
VFVKSCFFLFFFGGVTCVALYCYDLYNNKEVCHHTTKDAAADATLPLHYTHTHI